MYFEVSHLSRAGHPELLLDQEHFSSVLESKLDAKMPPLLQDSGVQEPRVCLRMK